MTRVQIERSPSEVVDARRKGDADTVAKHFAADAVYSMSGTPDLEPITASHRRSETLWAVVTHMMQTRDLTNFPTAASIHVGGKSASAHYKGNARHVQSKTRLNFDLLAREGLKDGLNTESLEFSDTSDAQ